ncbi:MAG: LemA family protein [Flavobacteriales bacterium]
MNKVLISVLVLLAVVVGGFAMFYFYGAGVRDKAIAHQETVKESWGNVQSAYQRRADLIGNLVETVKGAAATETNILIGVTEARSGIVRYADSVSTVIDQQKEQLKNAKTPAELQQGDVMMMNTYRGFRGFLSENYPDLKSIQNFGMLQTELEGTENRIKTERDRYNESVKEYNTYIRGTWRKMALGLVADDADELTVREMFEAKEGADEAPKVQF